MQKRIDKNFHNEIIKGLKLERDAHQFLWDLGYLVFPRLTLYAIRYKYTDNKESIDKIIVTDLDVFGVLFGNFLEKNSFIIDCKHRSEPIFSQILRSKGISAILEVNNLLILRESVPETVQQFAEKFGIRLLAVSEFVKKIKKRQKGSFNLKTYLKIEEIFNNQDRASKNYEVKFSNCFLEKDSFKRIKILRVLYNSIKEDIKSTTKDTRLLKLKSYILLQIILLTLVTIAEIANETIHLSSYHFKDYIDIKLIGDPEFKKEFFAKIRAIEEGIDPKSQIIPLKEIAPTFSDSLKELVKEFHNNAEIVQKYLRFVDFLIHEYFLHEKKINYGELEEEFGNINKELFASWNLKCLEILDDKKVFPIFLSELLG